MVSWGPSGVMQPNIRVDINQMHTQLGHCHEAMVCTYAKDCGIHLTREWQQYSKGCVIGKTHLKPVPIVMESKSERRLGQMFINLSRPKPRASSPGGYLYKM
ncbi:unnamed protein product [Choristocarpus tenellus]